MVGGTKVTTFIGDQQYWEGGSTVEEQDGVEVAVEQEGLEQDGYVGTSAMVQSVVEPWKDGIIVRTTSVPQPTLVEFSFSDDEENEDGYEEQEVVSGTADLGADNGEEE